MGMPVFVKLSFSKLFDIYDALKWEKDMVKKKKMYLTVLPNCKFLAFLSDVC